MHKNFFLDAFPITHNIWLIVSLRREYFLSILEMKISATYCDVVAEFFLLHSQQFDFFLWHQESFIHNVNIYIYHYPYNDILLIMLNHWTPNDWTLDKYPQHYPINHWTTNFWYFPNIISIINSMITLIIGRWFRETFYIYLQYPIYDYTNHLRAIF